MSVADRLKEPLRVDADPFAAGSAVPHVGRAVQAAFREAMRQILLQAPVIVVSGSAGTGKTLLADMIARACGEIGLTSRHANRGDMAHLSLGQPSDVLLVDEANSISDAALESLAPKEGKNVATTTVFLCLPSCASRFSFANVQPVVIELTAFSQSDARNYLLERARSVGLSDLFAPDALDVIIKGSLGSPRLLRSIASLAFFGAASEGAPQIALKNASSAVGAQIPAEPAQAGKNAPAPRAEERETDDRDATGILSVTQELAQLVASLARQGQENAAPDKSKIPASPSLVRPAAEEPAAKRKEKEDMPLDEGLVPEDLAKVRIPPPDTQDLAGKIDRLFREEQPPKTETERVVRPFPPFRRREKQPRVAERSNAERGNTDDAEPRPSKKKRIIGYGAVAAVMLASSMAAIAAFLPEVLKSPQTASAVPQESAAIPIPAPEITPPVSTPSPTLRADLPGQTGGQGRGQDQPQKTAGAARGFDGERGLNGENLASAESRTDRVVTGTRRPGRDRAGPRYEERDLAREQQRAVEETSNALSTPLSEEEREAVARGIREMERAATGVVPLSRRR
jgi:hypothetical protein